MMTKEQSELFSEFNRQLITIFSNIEFEQIAKLPELRGFPPKLIESKLKSEPVKLPCKIIFDAGRSFGVESQLGWLFLELQIKYFLLKNGDL